MRTIRPHDFRKREPEQRSARKSEAWYDIWLDDVLIQQSIAKQYGILPSAQGDLAWWEWSRLVSGLMDDTPLGRVVAVRAEQDLERIKAFTPWQREIRNQWLAHQAQKSAAAFDPQEWRKEMDGLERMLAKAFGGGEGV